MTDIRSDNDDDDEILNGVDQHEAWVLVQGVCHYLTMSVWVVLVAHLSMQTSTVGRWIRSSLARRYEPLVFRSPEVKVMVKERVKVRVRFGFDWLGLDRV